MPGMLGWFNIKKAIRVIYHINKQNMKKTNKPHRIISIEAKKTFTKPVPIFGKNSQRTVSGGELPLDRRHLQTPTILWDRGLDKVGEKEGMLMGLCTISQHPFKDPAGNWGVGSCWLTGYPQPGAQGLEAQVAGPLYLQLPAPCLAHMHLGLTNYQWPAL